MNYALVTGGSRGIGRAICLKLADMGYSIIVNYTSNEAAANEVKAAVEAKGVKADILRFDVGNKEQVDAAIDSWLESHAEDNVAVLVNNAGIRRDNLMVLMPDEDWSSVINTTVNGFFYVTRRFLKGMISKKFGRIINIVSLSGLKGLPGQTNYSSSKAAIIGATKALAQEVASRKITVNGVAPGFIATDMTQDLDQETLKKQIPAKRFGTPEEVAALVGFLASEDAAYINGEIISINGALYT
jgi:3-oxoacyl-[acyl-carrier protein] reductase